MSGTSVRPELTTTRSRLDRALAVFTDVHAGEGATAVLMLVNVFVLLVCYSVIKTVREPLILLGGGAEVRSYAAAGQALLLIAFVPAYSRLAARVSRMRLILGVTFFFLACIELFAAAVAAGVRYVGVAFFIWVGIFNISLVAQFWSFANDIYRKSTADRLFPLIMLGMTGGAPLGSMLAARLFRAGVAPQAILQCSALLLAVSAALYVAIDRRVAAVSEQAGTESDTGLNGFSLVLRSPYLRLVAVLVVLLNIVNTTGEYVVAKLLTAHVADLAAATPGFDKRAFIGAFSGEYQFWVNVTALALQAFVAARLVRSRGLAGVLLVLPLIALGGYGLVAAGAGFALVRWIKTAENATDYSIMNTARQLLWLPTTTEEKYAAKQAIDTFCVRAGDVLSAAVVYVGTARLHLAPAQFALMNVALTVAWLAIAIVIARPGGVHTRIRIAKLAGAVAALWLCLMPQSGHAQETRAESMAQARAAKAADLHEYEPTTLERRIDLANRLLEPRAFGAFVGGVMEGGGLAVGPAIRTSLGETANVSAHAAWSVRNYTALAARLEFRERAGSRVRVGVGGEHMRAPTVAYFGVGPGSQEEDRRAFGLRQSSVTADATIRVARHATVGGAVGYLDTTTDTGELSTPAPPSELAWVSTRLSLEHDTRMSPQYSRSGGLARLALTDYRQAEGDGFDFRRVDAELQRFVPLNGESQVLAVRGLLASTMVLDGADVPFFMLPALGGHRALRGYAPWRFRDRHALLLTGEYRWMAGPLVDMALFADAGSVGPSLERVSRDGLRVTYGAGLTIHTPSTTLTRFEVAKSREGLGFLISFGPSF
ncbi:MAG: BamA/TamA family outer membrane protein [Acidobacteria bacterium]|nr:BamA/TamA family outer membrane protein [Acidobacteriota bacterium]